MPKTVSPTLILTPREDRHIQIEEAIALVDTLTRDEIAEFATKLNLAALKGFIDLSTKEHMLLTALTRKFIPDAPKEIKLEHTITPQEYLGKALTSNLDDYQQLQLQATQFAALEEAKTQQLYDALWEVETDSRQLLERSSNDVEPSVQVPAVRDVTPDDVSTAPTEPTD